MARPTHPLMRAPPRAAVARNCVIVDTWWQTETGGILITPLPGAIPTKPGSATKPFFGVVPKVLREDGSEADTNENGILIIERAWPGMFRMTQGDPKNELVKKVYFSVYPGKFFTTRPWFRR